MGFHSTFVSGECDEVVTVGAVGVSVLVMAASVESLTMLFSYSNAWRCLDGSLAFLLFCVIISTSCSLAICTV